MTIKEYKENINVEFAVTAFIEDEQGNERTETITGLSLDSLMEQEHKLDHAINNSITEMYEELPESEV